MAVFSWASSESVHRQTIEIYEDEGAAYAIRRGVQRTDLATDFSESLPDGRLRLDLGCGPGHHLPLLGDPAVALDGAHAMAAASRAAHPSVPAVQAELAHLPFDRATFVGVWASKVLQHLPAAELPAALAEVHHILALDGLLHLTAFGGPQLGPHGHREEVSEPGSGDDLPGRLFTWWDPHRLSEVVEAAGFEVESLGAEVPTTEVPHPHIHLAARARRRLPDHVGTGMRLLCCGLNPSLHAADAGVGYVTASNRFWPALAAAGLATRDRDPRHLLRQHRIGMTDLVKRATPRAADLEVEEYREGLERLRRLCEWLRPAALAVVGLAGWRAVVDRRAVVGWQPEDLGGAPVYLMPSTSGLNARVSLDELSRHLRTATSGP